MQVASARERIGWQCWPCNWTSRTRALSPNSPSPYVILFSFKHYTSLKCPRVLFRCLSKLFTVRYVFHSPHHLTRIYPAISGKNQIFFLLLFNSIEFRLRSALRTNLWRRDVLKLMAIKGLKCPCVVTVEKNICMSAKRLLHFKSCTTHTSSCFLLFI